MSEPNNIDLSFASNKPKDNAFVERLFARLGRTLIKKCKRETLTHPKVQE